jgi:hypothetical protein
MMATAPYGIRLLVGAAVTAFEETRKLPQAILMYPITLASQAAQLVMRIQQNVADLVNKGDEALDSLFPPKEEKPEWATFDEDAADAPTKPVLTNQRVTEGRFALYSSGEPGKAVGRASGSGNSEIDPPAVVARLGYESLTLAQLRARLQSLRVPELEALLAYEDATKARAPFQTLLANRITRASAR